MLAGQDVSRTRQIQVLTPTNEHLAAASAVDPSRDAIATAWREAVARRDFDPAALVSTRWNKATVVTGFFALALVVVSLLIH
jgi:hypothetical protein